MPSFFKYLSNILQISKLNHRFFVSVCSRKTFKTMEIQIDAREKELFPEMEKLHVLDSFSSVNIRKTTLPLGDVIINHQEKPVCIFERKTYADLLASIKDGRYKEQQFRLNEHFLPNTRIYYVLEGNKLNLRSDPRILSSMTSLSVFRGFSVLRSSGVEETAIMISHMTKKIYKSLQQGKIPFFYDKKEDQTYESTLKIKKKRLDQEGILKMMLCQIPGISLSTAEIIYQQYNSIEQLYKVCSDKDKFQELSLLKTSKGKRLPSTVILKLKDMFGSKTL